MIAKISKAAILAIEAGAERGDPIAELVYVGLEVRYINILEESKYNIFFLRDLLNICIPELLTIPNISGKAIETIFFALSRYDRLDSIKARYAAMCKLKAKQFRKGKIEIPDDSMPYYPSEIVGATLEHYRQHPGESEDD